MDVLYWIRGQSRKFKPFVANRVGEIQALTNPEQWRHVPTKQNPADLLTRGLSVSALSEEERWWKGPLFLKYDHTQWPPTRTEREKEADVELRQICQAKEQIKEQSFLSLPNEDRLNPQRYSSWTKLTRIAAWVNRFLENCRSPVAVRRQDTIQPDEIPLPIHLSCNTSCSSRGSFQPGHQLISKCILLYGVPTWPAQRRCM